MSDESFDFTKAYRVEEFGGVAWRATGYAQWNVISVTDDGDEEIYSEEYETVDNKEMVVAHMIGDDQDFTLDVSDMVPLEDDEYCRDCGQIGCGHNVYE